MENPEFLKLLYQDHIGWACSYKGEPQWRGQKVNGQDLTWTNDPEANNYFCISTLKPNQDGKIKRVNDCFESLVCIVLDDINTKIPISNIPINPSWIVRTSTNNGVDNFQYGYRLTDPCYDFDRARHFVNALAHLGLLSDKGMSGLPRYARSPIGNNGKADYAQPQPHKLTRMDAELTYTLDELADAFGINMQGVEQTKKGEYPQSDVTTTEIIADIVSGDNYHDATTKLAFRMALQGCAPGFINNTLAGLMQNSANPGDTRWQERYDDIPRITADAVRKIRRTESFDPSRVIQHNPSTVAHLHDLPHPDLDLVADWMQKSVYVSTRTAAVAATIALASVAAGRVYRTNLDNYSPLLMAVSAETGGGKDFIKSTIDSVLVAAELQNVMGPTSFTSEAALRTTLIRKPCCISVVDEFGDKLKKASQDSSGHESAAFSAMKEVYSSASGVWAPRAYSEAKSPAKAKLLEDNSIYNPSLTMVGLATPGQLFGAISGEQREGGFLNRFIMIDASRERVCRNRHPERGMLDWLPKRIAEIRKHGIGLIEQTFSDFEEEGAEEEASEEPKDYNNEFDEAVVPRVVEMSSEVSDLFWDFADATVERFEGDPLKRDLSTRWHENAMRMALGLAVFINHKAPKVDERLARWCMGYVRHHGEIFIGTYESNNVEADSAFGMQKSKVLNGLIAAGADGVTKRQMNRKAPFNSFRSRELAEILASLVEGDQVMVEENASKTQEGRATKVRTTYYAVRDA